MFNKSTGNTGDGPLKDHGTFSAAGSYMLVSPNRGKNGYKLAELYSPTLQDASADCTLRFW